MMPIRRLENCRGTVDTRRHAERNMTETEPKRGAWNWWYLLFAVQFLGALWPPFYNKAEPHLFGIPFFYWFQLAWVFVCAVLTAIVYWATDD
jgi:dolichyl-phosphate-mannose--protein O-mannosyl transferase